MDDFELWALSPSELVLVVAKRHPYRLDVALLLKGFQITGRFATSTTAFDREIGTNARTCSRRDHEQTLAINPSRMTLKPCNTVVWQSPCRRWYRCPDQTTGEDIRRPNLLRGRHG